jgi:hypothetical protein
VRAFLVSELNHKKANWRCAEEHKPTISLQSRDGVGCNEEWKAHQELSRPRGANPEYAKSNE